MIPFSFWISKSFDPELLTDEAIVFLESAPNETCIAFLEGVTVVVILDLLLPC